MIELYRTKNERVYEKLKCLLPEDAEIRKTENGKPYTDGMHFSITHTGDTALIAVSDLPVGIDAEIERERPFSSVLQRFTDREKSEIGENLTAFLKNWVVKEAYIKLIGGTLEHDLKELEYFRGQLFYGEKKTDCNLLLSSSGDLIFCVCSQGEIPLNFKINTI